MNALQIFILLFIGIALFMLDIFLVPGMIVGSIGIITSIVAIIFAYQSMGVWVGTLLLAGTATLNIFLIYWGMNRLSKSPLAVRKVIDGKVNVFEKHHLHVGDTAMTVTALRPEGKVMIGSEIVTVWSQVGFVEANTEVEVVAIQENKIFVKKVNK